MVILRPLSRSLAWAWTQTSQIEDQWSTDWANWLLVIDYIMYKPTTVILPLDFSKKIINDDTLDPVIEVSHVKDSAFLPAFLGSLGMLIVVFSYYCAKCLVFWFLIIFIFTFIFTIFITFICLYCVVFFWCLLFFSFVVIFSFIFC